jgi:hypothetical protein
MRSRTAALAIGALALGLGTMAHAQESRPTPDIRMLLTQPTPSVTPDSPPVPDLRDLPQGKMDKPPTHPSVTVIIGDSRCAPGEDGMGEPRQLGRSNRSRRFP